MMQLLMMPLMLQLLLLLPSPDDSFERKKTFEYDTTFETFVFFSCEKKATAIML